MVYIGVFFLRVLSSRGLAGMLLLLLCVHHHVGMTLGWISMAAVNGIVSTAAVVAAFVRCLET